MDGNGWVYLIKVIFYTGGVVALCFGLAYLFKKFLQSKLPFENNLVKIMTIKNISPSHKIALIEHNGKRILIGYTRNYITKIDSFDVGNSATFKSELYEQMEGNNLEDVRNKVKSWQD